MERFFSIIIFIIIATMSLNAQSIIPLYPHSIPNTKVSDIKEEKNVDSNGSIRYGNVTDPTLEICLPDKNKANGVGVLIIPGGGYRIVSYTNEGTDIAKEFNKIGITAFILKYRLPSEATMENKSIGPIQDAQQALNIIRKRAKEWHLNPHKIGTIGFSAGGHLASTLGTQFNHAYLPYLKTDDLRPDFLILGYPVINLSDSLMHRGSKDNLLGASASKEMTDSFSNDLQVTPNTPPTFLFHASDDKTVKVQNSIHFYEALLKNNVPVEMHIYYKGGHGFGIKSNRAPDHWTDRVETWLKNMGVIEK